MTRTPISYFPFLLTVFLLCTVTEFAFGQHKASSQELIFKLKEEHLIKKSNCGGDINFCLQQLIGSKTKDINADVREFSSRLANNTFISSFNSSTDLDQIINDYIQTGLFEYVERNHIENPLANYPVPTFPSESSFSNQWALKNEGNLSSVYSIKDSDIDMEYAWSIEKGNAGITVAVLDTGVDYTHPDLVNKVWTNTAEIANNGIDDDNNGYVDDVNGYDFAESDNDPQDVHGHGTHIAGIIGADAANGTGFVGLDWNCKLMLLKVVRDNFTSSYSDYADAITYAADHGAKVINLSLTSYYYSTILEQAFAYAHSKGVVIVVAMGNDGDSTTHFMASSQYSIAVGATTPADKTASFSNYKNHIDVVAPGSYIYGLQHSDHNSETFRLNGTSQATAFVSGLASLLFAQNPTRSPEDIRQIIRLTAEDQVGPSHKDLPGFDNHFGYGRINAYEALAYEPGFAEVIFNSQESFSNDSNSSDISDDSVPEEDEPSCRMAIHSQFEDGFGDWSAGGIDALLSDNSGKRNSRSIKLIDNSGAASSIFTAPINGSTMNVLDLSFGFYPLSMEDGEDFMFEMSIDGGVTFEVLRSWVSGIDFNNREYIDETVLLSDLAMSDQTVFRFRCDASSNSDYIFLDNITINLCDNIEAIGCEGTACDDGDACTVNDVYTSDCNCVGTYEDKDNDGFCVGEDVDDLDSCLPDNSGCGEDNSDAVVDCAVMSSHSFETESDVWILGGEDVSLSQGFGVTGLTAVKLRDDSGVESSIYTKALDLQEADQVTVDFHYYGISMESGEGFIFEISMDNGRSFIEYKSWVSGIDFLDRQQMADQIVIPQTYLTDRTIFRFRANGNSNADAVYIDDIIILLCSESNKPSNGVASVDLPDNTQQITPASLSVYPNPTVDFIHLDTQHISDSDYDVYIYTVGGTQVYHSQFSVGDEVRIDVSAFHGATQYILSVVTPQSTTPLTSTSFFKN